MYAEYFGLREKPFNVTPDPRFLYLSANHQEALAAMLYGIQERRGIISVIGEVGTGKTTLIRALLNELDEHTETILIFNTNVTFNELLKNILWELDIPSGNETKAELIQHLNQYLISRLAAGSNVALIIDEAQNLSLETLEEIRMLSNLETEKEKLLQILFIGQPELLAKLNSPSLRQLKQRIAISYFLEPLTIDDSMKYIAHRLSVAACRNGAIFSPQALELICKHSRGIPRIINMLCDNSLLAAFGRNKRRVDAGLVQECIADYDMIRKPVNTHDRPQRIDSTKGKKVFPPPPKRHFRYLYPVIFLVVFFALGLAALGIWAYGNRLAFFDPLVSAPSRDSSFSPLNHESSIQEPVEPAMPLPSSVMDESMRDDGTPADGEEVPAHNMYADSSDATQQPHQDQTAPSADTIASSTDPLPAVKAGKEVFAKRNDMVSAFVLKEYGAINDSLFDLVKRANPGIKDLDRISIGQKIILPPLDIDSVILAKENGLYAIHLQSFNSYESASNTFSDSAWNGYPVLISPVMIAGGHPWYRATVGNFSDRKQAIELVNKLGFSNLPLLKDSRYGSREG